MADPEWTLEWAMEQNVAASTLVACTTLVAYDYMLTFSQEVEHVWQAPHAPGKILYLLLRYVAFLDLAVLDWNYLVVSWNVRICSVMTDMVMWLELIGILLGCLVIGLRTWAIWTRDRICGALVVVAFLIAVGYGISAVVVFTTGITVDVGFSGPVPGCMSSPTDIGLLQLQNFYVVLASYEAFILLATIIRGINHLRLEKARLTTVLYRDAFIGSAILCVTSVLSAYMASSGNMYFFSYTYIHRTMTIIIPTRITLNIRAAAYTLDGWDTTSETMPNIPNFVMDEVADVPAVAGEDA